MKFSNYDFHPKVKQGIEELGFRKPTDIQYKAIPSILKGEDILAIAQTGTGKTGAFAIPIIDTIMSADFSFGVKVIVMAPTHELALQITNVFNAIGKHTTVRALALIGGVDQAPQIKALENGVDIVVATPGRLFDMVSQMYLKLRNVEMLVLDEADLMIDIGFNNDITHLIDKLPTKRQTLFFSATINEKIKNLAYSIVNNPIRIQISPKDPVSKNISHSVMKIEMDDKRYFLEQILKEHPESRVLVFVRTKVRAERVLAAMKRVDISSDTIHSGKDQEARSQAMDRFAKGINNVLIATDVSARGVDIANVDYVVNYDLPDVAENYVHRVGRTGRGMNKGVAVSFCAPEEQVYLDAIENFTQTKIRVGEVNRAEYKAVLDFTDEVTGSVMDLINQEENFLAEKKVKKNKDKAKKNKKKKTKKKK